MAGRRLCTHGPDRTPDERQVQAAQFSAQATSSTVACIGDGRSGKRVQVV